MVIVSHLIGVHASMYLGFYAVRAFFVLSGFAITAALNDVYSFDGRRFWMNRTLRVAPPYLITCLFTAAAILAFPDEAARFMPRWGFPLTSTEIVENIAIIPLAFRHPDFRFLEQGWSIAVESIMYFVLFASVARRLQTALIIAIIGAAFHAVLIVNGGYFNIRYFSIPAALFSFSLGALCYFLKKGILRPRIEILVLGGGVWAINLLAGISLAEEYSQGIGFYLNTLSVTLLIAGLPSLHLGRLLKKIDDVLGELSYPIFLVQWLGAFIGYLLLSSAVTRGWLLIFISAPIILLLASLVAWVQQCLVEPARVIVRGESPTLDSEAMGPIEIGTG
jgi:peptidoglycan/LPS O-acetylase OafA/YrhL